MSVKSKKKCGRKPSRSTLSKKQRQAKSNKAFLACKKKEMAEALVDKPHVMMVESDGNYVTAYYYNRKPRHLYGTFCYAKWLLPNFYFRTINKGVRVNLLHLIDIKEKEGMYFMIFKGKKPVLIDAKNTKNLECLRKLLLEPRFLEARKNFLK